MIKRKKPRLMIVKGKVIIVTIGLTNTFTIPNIRADQNPAQIPVIVIPGIMAEVINKASIVINTLAIILSIYNSTSKPV